MLATSDNTIEPHKPALIAAKCSQPIAGFRLRLAGERFGEVLTGLTVRRPNISIPVSQREFVVFHDSALHHCAVTFGTNLRFCN
jgi:hypothetical protein